MLITVLILLILFSAFFSASETGMMAVNRYRLRHLSRKSHKRATRVLKLLERPDRLLGVIILGNTCCTILASVIATMLAVGWFGEGGVWWMTLVLTFILLILGETAPKTLAALFSQSVALRVSWSLSILLKILSPFVWLINVAANGFLRIFGVRVDKNALEILTLDELRSIVHEATGRSASHYQDMLLRVLDLQQITVEEVMVPKNEIYGIDLTQEWSMLVAQLLQSSHAYLPVYREHIDKIQGMLTLRDVLVKLTEVDFGKAALERLVEEVYFIPEGIFLHNQVLNFQKEKKHVGLVVDEYGDIQGLLTLRDLMEEIAGDFAMSAVEVERFVATQEDGSVLVDGSISIRVLNRLANWHFPINGARTLSGLIIETLESIPKTAICVVIAGYRIEVLSVSRNTIQQVRVSGQGIRNQKSA